MRGDGGLKPGDRVKALGGEFLGREGVVMGFDTTYHDPCPRVAIEGHDGEVLYLVSQLHLLYRCPHVHVDHRGKNPSAAAWSDEAPVNYREWEVGWCFDCDRHLRRERRADDWIVFEFAN